MFGRIRIILLLLLTLSVMTACDNDDDSVGRPLFIDTDMAVDDAMAILYLLQHPDFEVKGITVSGTGFAHVEAGVRNALNLAAAVNRSKIPVAAGDTIALNGVNHVNQIPAEWRVDADRLGGLTLSTNPNPPVAESAEHFLGDEILDSKEKVTLVALGPLTNIALALQIHPGLQNKIAKIYIMGGAVDVPGNIQWGGVENNTVAEWNIYLDPHAADVVFRSGIPIVLVPLDATDLAPVHMTFFNRLSADRTTSSATLVYQIMDSLKSAFDDWYYFWDPLAAAIATDESLVIVQTKKLVVVTAETDESGRTKTDNTNGSPVGVCAGTRLADFEMLFLDVLNGR